LIFDTKCHTCYWTSLAHISRPGPARRLRDREVEPNVCVNSIVAG
jgi:hypothetical protein